MNWLKRLLGGKDKAEKEVKESIDCLIDYYKRNLYHIHQQAIVDLVNIGPPAVEPLIQALNDSKYDYESVIETLGQIGDPRAVEPIFEQLAGACFTVRLCAPDPVKTVMDTAIVALTRIGVPAQKYASEMLERPSERLLFKVENVDISQAANLVLEGAEKDREDEQLANKLVTLIRQAVSVYSSDKEAYEKTSSEIRKIGEGICSNGGSKRMTKIAYQVQALGESIRNLELHWKGICGWQF